MISIHITGEGETLEQALEHGEHIAKMMNMLSPVVKDEFPMDGTTQAIKIGETTIGCVSIEKDGQMNDRMRMRVTGSKPALELGNADGNPALNLC